MILTNSSLPVLRKLRVLREGKELLRDEDSLNMLKVWLALEVRQFIHASTKDVRILSLNEFAIVDYNQQSRLTCSVC